MTGGSFLIEDTVPADVFTPEDFIPEDVTEEHLAIALGHPLGCTGTAGIFERLT